VAYLRLWDHIGKKLPKRRGNKAASDSEWIPPATLDGAMHSLYRSYANSFERWEKTLQPLGEPPPVMIMVCPNTVVSKLVYDWIAGQDVEGADGVARARHGEFELFSNVVDGSWMRRPPNDPGRLRTARERRGDEGRLQGGRLEGDRAVQV